MGNLVQRCQVNEKSQLPLWPPIHFPEAIALLTAVPSKPVTSENASTVPVTLPTDPSTVEPTVDIVLSTVSNAPSVGDPPIEVEPPDSHSEENVVEFVTSLPVESTSHAAEELEVQPLRKTERFARHLIGRRP
jgi:hypothetical protein